MKKFSYFLLLALLVMACTTATTTKTTTIPQKSIQTDELSIELATLGFIEKDIPEVGSKQWYKAAHSYPSHYVTNENGLTIRIATREEDDPIEIVFESGSVKYLGVDKGEWGGSLTVSNTAKSDKAYSGPLGNLNIKALIPIDNDLYIFSGLAHMSADRGEIFVVRDFNTPSPLELITLLPTSPQAVFLDKTWNGKPKFIIAGFNSLMSHQPEYSFEIIKFDTFWTGLYPSSVVRYKDNYILGIRSGLAVVSVPNIDSKTKVRYFAPKEFDKKSKL